jgi:hypothetical protein
MTTASTATTVGLSSKGLGNVCKDDNDFTLVVGSRCYQCPTMIAEFLSPRVCDLHALDPTAKELLVLIDDPKDVFSELLSLGDGKTIAIDSAKRSAIMAICGELWNSELYENLRQGTSDEVTVEGVIERLTYRSRMHSDTSEEVEFLASHFYDISDPMNELRALPLSVVRDVVSHPSLRVASEDSLYDFIVSQLSEDPSALECVRFEYLSVAKFVGFVDLISNAFECLTPRLWESLRSRLSFPVLAQSTNDRVFLAVRRVSEFRPSPYSPWNGIISYLTRRFGGNVHDSNVVAITASSNNGNFEKYAADLAVNNCFCSQNAPNSWICYDFKRRKIMPTHYSIGSYFNGSRGNNHPKDWVIEGSNDGTSWMEIDRREDNSDLNASNVTRNFAVARSVEVRMIRLRQIGANHFGDHYLLLSSFEIFGSLIE